MRFGPYLKSLRVKAGLTQRGLALKCGLSSVYVTQLETQRIQPPTRKVCSCLARALETEGDQLWKRAFVPRLERWLKKEGFKAPSPEVIAAFFDGLSKKE